MGKARLISELIQKGIEPEAAERAALEAYAEYDEHELARVVASKRVSLYRKETESKQKQKLAAYLRQRGFDWEIITAVVDETLS